MSNDGKIDIGNVRGIQGEKGEKGDKGSTPSYEDIKYAKKNDEFVTQKTTGDINQYYLDSEGNLCDENGYILDENKEPTENTGVPFDVDEYGYAYKPIWLDEDDKETNSKGEFLDEQGNVMYVPSDFVSDITGYMYNDEEAYSQIVNDIYPLVADTLISPDPNSENYNKYQAFLDLIEGDIKYYICADDPDSTIVLNNNVVENKCKYKNENGELVTDGSGYAHVPLEKNALYLYNGSGYETNDIMHYDIYVCIKANTIPIKLISSSDFSIDYNVIDGLRLYDEQGTNPVGDEKDIILKIETRGTRGQFYSMDDVDTLLMNNLINKLGANNGIAQLNGSGKVPSSQLPAYIDDVVEGTMNNAETVFTPSNNDYIDSVKQTGKIYVDTTTKKTYRWTGSEYVFISNPIVVDDNSTTAYGSSKGQALETKIGTGSLNTTATTLVGAINEHESDISSINTNKQNKTDNSLVTSSKTVVGAINELSTNKVDKVTGKGLSSNDYTDNEKTKLNDIETGATKNTVVDSISDGNMNAVTSNAVYDALSNVSGSNIPDVFDELNENEIFLLLDKDVIQSGDSVLLSATLYGDIAPNQTVYFFKVDDGSYISVGSAVANGYVASYVYTGTGVGEIEFVASLDSTIVSGSLLTKTYELLDCLKYDDMSTDTHSNYASNNGSITYDSTNKAIVFTKGGSGGSYVEFECTGTALNDYLGKTLEFKVDIVSADANVNLNLYQLVNGTYVLKESSYATSGTLTITNAEIDSSTTRVRFRINTNVLASGEVVKSKNWKIYPI